jgi:hypothetical protein
LKAYDDLKVELKAVLGEDPIFSEFGSWLPKMTADANAGALDAGLDAALMFVELAPADSVKPYADKLFSNVIDKAFGARASTLSKGKALLLKLIEVDDPNACTLYLLTHQRWCRVFWCPLFSRERNYQIAGACFERK